MRGAKKWCVNDHDTYKVGRTGSGHCSECARLQSLAYQAERRARGEWRTTEMGRAPGLKAWRESLGLALKDLSLECGLTSGKSHKDFKPKVGVELLARLEAGGEARAETRLHIAQTLWRIEQGMGEKEPGEAERLRVAGVA